MKIAEVQFDLSSKVYEFDANELDLSKGDIVVVQTSDGYEVGRIINLKPCPIQKDLPKVLKKADEEDLERFKKILYRREKFKKICQQKADFYKLPIKILNVVFSQNGQKIIVYFSSETRVDFRDFVKDLNDYFKKPVRLHQIGVRDEARILGGIGFCGRELCCERFLKNLQSVTMEMVRLQGMDVVSNTKISGLCGKLMCCLNFETKFYQELAKKMPKEGSKIKINGELGTVIDRKVLQQKILVEFEDGSRKEVSLEEANA